MKRKILIAIIFAVLPYSFAHALGEPKNDTLDLSGKWSCTLDKNDAGISEEWFSKDLKGLDVHLPGGLNENRMGDRTDVDTPEISSGKFAPEDLSKSGENKIMAGLKRTYTYIGKAWYQKEIEIGQDWDNKHLTLYLERCGWETSLWIDGKKAGSETSLVTPHIYDISHLLKPGKHRITILCDNKPKINYGGMMIAEDGYTNWNGIIGKMEITAKEKIHINSVKIFPSVAYTQADSGDQRSNSILCKIKLGNKTGKAFSGRISLSAFQVGSEKNAEVHYDVKGSEDPTTEVELRLKAFDANALWNEFDPAMYHLKAKISVKTDTVTYNDQRMESFGMRDLFRDGTQFTINHKPVFLRGILDNGISPLLGRPDTDVETWERRFKILKSYGFNYYRCHSNVPPEAAFEAADRTGIYLQIELSRWSCPIVDEPENVSQFAQRELERILDTYGNHPSFCFLSMGNELLIYRDEIFLEKQQAMLMRSVNFAQKTDKRHQYTCTTHPITPNRNDDFYVSASYAGINPLGIRWGGHNPIDKSRFCLETPSTDDDYREMVHQVNRPVITHEVGQWQVFPNLAEIPKYTGALTPDNFRLIEKKLQQKNMLDQAPSFTKASGRLAFVLYKEEIESAMRTPGLAGFQLLNLYDYPGQGTSTVGMLDAFWDSKGITSPQEYSSFNSAIVPLLRMPKRVWTNDEIFEADAELAFFTDKPMHSIIPVYKVSDESGHVIAERELPFIGYIPVGEKIKYPVALGHIKFPLKDMQRAAKYTIEISLKGTAISNNWEFWVYPSELNVAPSKEILISKECDHKVTTALNEGRTVLLLSGSSKYKNAIPGVFTTVFWNTQMKNQQVGTMGLLMNPKHALFKDFPTDFHTNWQWWDLLMHSQSIEMNDTDADFRPIIQVIDNPYRNHKLGVVFEARVGKGKLLFCGFDIDATLESRPAARQLRYSISNYLISPDFAPKNELTVRQMNDLFESAQPAGAVTQQ